MSAPAIPRRGDLRSRPKQFAAALLRGILRAYETTKSRFLIDVASPDDDAFYERVEELHSCSPGEVIESRSIEVRMLRRVLPMDAWQLKFCTRLADSTEVAGVVTVMRSGRRDTWTNSLLAYQLAIDSLGPTGDPSYTLQRGDQLELPLMLLALRRGWAVIVVDWTGPHRSFVDLPSAAWCVLDGIRAALDFEPADLDAGASIGLWGYSGGALATLFAAEQHARYAPELNIVATAAGGAGVDMTSSPEMFEAGNLLSGIPFGASIAASRAFPDFDLAGHLSPQGRELVDAAQTMTMEQLALAFPFLQMSSILTVPTISDVPGARQVFEATRCGQTTPTMPMFLYHAVHDQAPDIADVDKLVEQYRRDGADVTYRRYRLGEHLIVMFRAVPKALEFLASRLT